METLGMVFLVSAIMITIVLICGWADANDPRRKQ